MTIGEYIKRTDPDTYYKLMRYCRSKSGDSKPPEISLGDRPENLMKANSYRRIGRRVKQTR